MATQIPMRMVESNEVRTWPSQKDAAHLASLLSTTAADELGLLLTDHGYHEDQRKMVPNRSGSAPPSMEGSFAAFGNLMVQQNSSPYLSLASLSSAFENFDSEEELRSDPAYFAYYYSNVNLNPRLPPPIISRENRHMVRHNGGFSNDRRVTTYGDRGTNSLHLSTHDEEPEDDGSPGHASNDWAESSRPTMSAQKFSSLPGRHKSLVDLIQEDFPRTPSPVYNLSHSSSHATAEDPTDHDVQALPLDDLSIDISKVSELDRCTQGGHATGVRSNDEPSVTSFPEESLNVMENSLPTEKFAADKDAGFEDDNLVSGANASVVGTPTLSSLHSAKDNKNKQQYQPYEKNVLQQPTQYIRPQRGINYQGYGGHAYMNPQGINYSHTGMEKVSHGRPKFSSVDVQPVRNPPGLTPPLYATAAAYMASGNQFYPNLHPSGLYAPQYSLGGYAVGSSFPPPYIAGYPSPTAVPIQFDAASGQSFNGQSTISTSGESVSHGGDMQHLNKFFGPNSPHGLMMQPSFVDPFHMHYFQRPVEDAYAASGHYGRVSSTGVFGPQIDPFGFEKESAVPACMADQKFQLLSNTNFKVPSPKMGGSTGAYYRSPSNMGVMSHFPASPLGSPVLPGSPVAGANPFVRRNEIKFPQGSIGNVGVSGWQGQRVVDSFNDPKKHSFLEELKSNGARKVDLSDIAGRIVEFSVDQHGSRFIQQKLENCSVEDKASVFREVLPHASKLMIDVFGNYVIQKFFEHGTSEQRKELADQLSGQMLPLSLQMYGCRVIQKALEVIEPDQKIKLVHELDGHVMRCVRDQNGNHVIQKCIECVPTEEVGFIISAFRGQVAALSTHPYGCRVIQRVLEHCSDELKNQCIVDEILESSYVLAQDQYGNYVTQHVLERGEPHERSQIIRKFSGKIVQLSQHKYASNVVEKCLEYGDAAERELMIEEILEHSEDNDNLLAMMKDQFANYVVQKILEISSDKQREVLLDHIRVHLHALKKYTYGKHIVARFEQLSGEDSDALDEQAA